MKKKVKQLFFAITGKEKGLQIIHKIKARRHLIPQLIKGEIGLIKKTIKCNHKWYGGFETGFYICPDLLNEKSIVYSFGIGLDISFEQKILDKHGSMIFGFDPTPKSIAWLKDQNISIQFKFYEFGIGATDELVTFYLPKNADHVSGSILVNNHVDDQRKITVPMKSFSAITEMLNHTKIDVLKMDIEGSEYEVLESIMAAPVVIDQILLEFHARYFIDGKQKTNDMIAFLRQHGYEVFAVSDSLEEVSFIRKEALA